MSFTFRDLFSEDDNEPSPETELGTPTKEESISRGSTPMDNKETRDVLHFLVSELLPFIPPAISAQSGIPMEKEVIVPVPANGSRDVELSTLYQVCPELFATEITPLNDSVVTLPTRLGGGGELPAGTSPFSAPVVHAEVDGSNSSSKGAEAAVASEENPFWSNSSGTSDLRAAHSSPPKQVVTGAKGFGNGFQSPSSDGAVVEGDQAPDVPKNKIEEEQNSQEPSDGTARISNGKPEEVFGFGSGFGAGGENPFDSTEGFATLFSKQAANDAGIPFPEQVESEEKRQDSENLTFEPEDLDPIVPVSPFSKVADIPEDFVKEEEQAKDIGPFESGFAAPTSSPLSRLEEASETEPEEPISEQVEKQEMEQEILENTEPGNSPVPGLNTEAPKNLEPKPEQGSEVSNDSENSSFVPVREVSTPPEDTPAPQEPEQRTAVSERDGDETLRDLEFKAIFSTSESFTLTKVARSIVSLSGITGCALATPKKIVQASKGEQGRIGEEAREMVDSIRNLARLSGLPEAKFFTLSTDCGIVSLFLEGDCCVTIQHDEGEFGPGIREKLILIARSIHKLEE